MTPVGRRVVIADHAARPAPIRHRIAATGRNPRPGPTTPEP